MANTKVFFFIISSFIFFKEVSALFELGDADRDGVIDLAEFIGVMTTSSPVPYRVRQNKRKLMDFIFYF